MKGKELTGLVLVLLGLFYALAPHTVHVSSGLGFGLDHTVHVVVGLVLLIAGAYIGWLMTPIEKHFTRPARSRRRRRR